MSISIKGMEMPKKYPVTVTIFPDGISVVKTISGRRFTTTAVSVPEPHGKLIDADALYASCALDTNIDVMASAKRINEYMQLKIDEAPTIISPEQEKIR